MKVLPCKIPKTVAMATALRDHDNAHTGFCDAKNGEVRQLHIKITLYVFKIGQKVSLEHLVVEIITFPSYDQLSY